MRIHRGIDAFVQTGTGATSRRLKDKARESISVKDFGAVGDGSTDDAVAIQAAIDAVAAVGGGCIHFPAGIYKHTSTLQFPITGDGTSIEFRGASCGFNDASDHAGTILRYQGAGVGINQYITNPTYQNRPGFILRDLVIDGDLSTAGATAVKFGGTTYTQMRNVTIQRYNGAGSIAIDVHNASGMFTERFNLHATLDDNKTGIQFKCEAGAVASFLHHSLEIMFTIEASQVGMALIAAPLFLGYMELNGNMNASTAKLMTLDATSVIQNEIIFEFLESTTAVAVTRFDVTAGGSMQAWGGFYGQGGLITDTGTVALNGVLLNDCSMMGQYLNLVGASGTNHRQLDVSAVTGQTVDIMQIKDTTGTAKIGVSKDAEFYLLKKLFFDNALAHFLDFGITVASAFSFSDNLSLGSNMLTAAKATLTGTEPTVSASQVGLGGRSAATATNGTGEAMKANVEGYIIANVAGATIKIPYVKN